MRMSVRAMEDMLEWSLKRFAKDLAVTVDLLCKELRNVVEALALLRSGWIVLLRGRRGERGDEFERCYSIAQENP